MKIEKYEIEHLLTAAHHLKKNVEWLKEVYERPESNGRNLNLLRAIADIREERKTFNRALRYLGTE